MPIKKTPVDELVVFGYDLKQRRVYLGTPVNCLSADTQIGEISPESAEMLSRVLDRMEDEFSNKPIEVHLSTFGGCVYSALKIIDRLQSSSCQIKIVASGPIMSAGFVIFSVGDIRQCHPHTRFMCHAAKTDEISGTTTDIKMESAELEWISNTYAEILNENTRMPLDFWKGLLRSSRDVFMSAQEVKDLGLADQILSHKKRGNLRRGPRFKSLNKPFDSDTVQATVNKIFKRMDMPTLSEVTVNRPKVEPIDESLFIDETPVPDDFDQTSRDVLEISKQGLAQIVEGEKDKNLAWNKCSLKN